MKNQHKSAHRQTGFTLIELLIVIVIIGVLSATLLPNLFQGVDDAYRAAVKSDIKNIETALSMYKLDNYRYPSTEQGLQALVTKPSGEPAPKKWRNDGYLPKLPLDPWKNEYQYIQPGIKSSRFDIYSLGADGVEGGEGPDTDIGNWNLSEL